LSDILSVKDYSYTNSMCTSEKWQRIICLVWRLCQQRNRKLQIKNAAFR